MAAKKKATSNKKADSSVSGAPAAAEPSSPPEKKSPATKQARESDGSFKKDDPTTPERESIEPPEFTIRASDEGGLAALEAYYAGLRRKGDPAQKLRLSRAIEKFRAYRAGAL